MLRGSGRNWALRLAVALLIGACSLPPTVTASPAPTIAASPTLAATPQPVASPATAAAALTPGSNRPIVHDAAAQKAWREDFTALSDQLRQQHPNPFYRDSEADFQKLVDTLDQ